MYIIVINNLKYIYNFLVSLIFAKSNIFYYLLLKYKK